ncbi:MAG: hypothetical protein HY457_01300 [Parcubacteria group bacterium]|nr:hypothetical protein [Parcubacteria group bacterium]
MTKPINKVTLFLQKIGKVVLFLFFGLFASYFLYLLAMALLYTALPDYPHLEHPTTLKVYIAISVVLLFLYHVSRGRVLARGRKRVKEVYTRFWSRIKTKR